MSPSVLSSSPFIGIEIVEFLLTPDVFCARLASAAIFAAALK